MTDAMLARIQYYGNHLLAAPLFGFRVKGADRVPRRGGLIIVCNHISELDPPILGFAIPRNVAFMAKIELFRSRMASFFMKELKAFPVNRSGTDTGAVRKTLDLLKQGMAVVIFPEGTRSRDGRLLPVKPGIGLIAAASGAPVMPTFIWGTDHPAGALLRRGDRFSVHFGELITAGKLREMKRESGTRGVASGIMSSIERLGIEAGLYTRHSRGTVTDTNHDREQEQGKDKQ